MAKRLFLLLGINSVMIIMSPWFLMAADTVNVVGVDDSRAVQTILPPEPEPVSEVAEPAIALAVTSESAQTSGPTRAPESAQTSESATATKVPTAGAASVANYTVTLVTSKIVATNLSYSDIYRTGKFVYAHNSANLLGNLQYLNYGDIFTITEGGVARNYRVMDKVVYEKAANGYLNGSKELTKAVEINANGYDVSIMTCTGTMYGNGGASHRLVLFANAI